MQSLDSRIADVMTELDVAPQAALVNLLGFDGWEAATVRRAIRTLIEAELLTESRDAGGRVILTRVKRTPATEITPQGEGVPIEPCGECKKAFAFALFEITPLRFGQPARPYLKFLCGGCGFEMINKRKMIFPSRGEPFSVPAVAKCEIVALILGA